MNKFMFDGLRNTGKKWVVTAVGALLCCGMVAPLEAAESQICVAPVASQNVCAETVPLKAFSPGQMERMNMQTVAPQQQKKDFTKPGAPTVDVSAQRDERKKGMAARQRSLLIAELQQTENLFKNTSKKAPDRVTIARRLAETYVELENAAFRDKINAEVDRDKARNDQKLAAQKETLVNQAGAVMKAANRNAIRYYALIKDEYSSYSEIDQVLYYLAYEYEQVNDYEHAQKTYEELVAKAPKSKWIPSAYFALGELSFFQAQSNPAQWKVALGYYGKVLNYPPPENKLYGYSLYKMAYVFWNTGREDKAIESFKKAITYAMEYPQVSGSSQLLDGGRRDILAVYAVHRTAAGAYRFFRPLSGDGVGSAKKTLSMLNDLGQHYLDTGRYEEAIAMYRDLIARDKGGDLQCMYSVHIAEATIALQARRKDLIAASFESLLKQYREFNNASHPTEAKQECANRTAVLITETAMSWHIEAVGSSGRPGTSDPQAIALATQFYKRILDTWKPQEFATFKFNNVREEDWPTLHKIKYAAADLLYFQKQWDQCGPAFDEVVMDDPKGVDAPEAAFASLLCYQNMYERSHAQRSDRKGAGCFPGQKNTNKPSEKEKRKGSANAPKWQSVALTSNQIRMIRAFDRYLCYINPDSADKRTQEQWISIQYARARIYFEARHWEEAAAGFKEIAFRYPDNEAGIFAAQLYLESINVLASHGTPPRTACFGEMETDVGQLLALYCSNSSSKSSTATPDQCSGLTRVHIDLQRMRAQQTIELADKGGPDALSTYEKGAGMYLDIFHQYCQQGSVNSDYRCDELVYNAARAYQAGRLLAKAIATRMILLNTKGFEHSPLVKSAVYEIGGNFQAIAVYDQAANWYERYQHMDPHGKDAERALSDAVLLRLGLGDEEKALDDATHFRKTYGQSKPLQAASVVFAVSLHYAKKAEKGDKNSLFNWEQARANLTRGKGLFAKAPPDVQIQAHSILARAYTHLHWDPQAAQEYAIVRGSWKDPNALVQKINQAYPSETEEQRQRRIGKTLDAVGEALFQEAEKQKKARVDVLHFPEYRGPGTKDSVLKHINTKVKAWITKKIPAIEKVSSFYTKILNLKPEPPPRWVIAAGSRVGFMWGDLVDDFRRAPIPEAWKKDAEIRGIYYDALDTQSEPIKANKAKPALVTCLNYSLKFQYFDQMSRSCEEWLAKNYKAEYHVIDELRGSPTLANPGIEGILQPVGVEGKPAFMTTLFLPLTPEQWRSTWHVGSDSSYAWFFQLAFPRMNGARSHGL
ncbi:tetratricopeptide repeat protein [Pajaroellobacter abortibovis]|nr:tetratricopeptide repeat protein [Pajaroellobacter abortibovis]